MEVQGLVEEPDRHITILDDQSHSRDIFIYMLQAQRRERLIGVQNTGKGQRDSEKS